MISKVLPFQVLTRSGQSIIMKLSLTLVKKLIVPESSKTCKGSK